MNSVDAAAADDGAAPLGRHQCKKRLSAAGLHLFDRTTGLNVLVDEIKIPAALHSRAPRQIAIAITNRCDLACSYCYAPKSRHEPRLETITRWLSELDSAGTLAVGFGGGEPTLYPEFVRLCQYAAHRTGLAVSFTTHGHHITREVAERLRGSVHFIRVSMDGVGATYESIRRRSFTDLLAHLEQVRAICSFGINVVINDRTLSELDDVAAIAEDSGARELLLLPQIPVRSARPIGITTMCNLRRWVDAYSGPLKLCINESSAEGFPTCDPLSQERGLRAYAHIDAAGVLKPTSYAEGGIPLGEDSVLHALDKLAHDLREEDV